MASREIFIKPGERITIVCEGTSEEKGLNFKSGLEATNYSDPETAGGGKKNKKNRTRKNNQAGGKKGPNGYMKFASKVRPQILKEHPELKSDVVAVARKIGAKWRAMSDAEKAKY